MRLARLVQAVCLLLAFMLAASAAKAEGRFALLIGNQSYSAKVGPLRNPRNDIALIGAKLKSLGFAVKQVADADYRGIDIAIKRHIQDVQLGGEGAISFVYYSGHGAADPDTRINYLIPVDVANADDDDLWTNSIDLNDIVEALRFEAPKAIHYVIFDACRNELNLVRKKGSAFKGFVPNAFPTGVMVAYATAPGKTAADSGSDGGPYAKALADEIGKPVEAMTMFRNVALRVQREIGQDPWMTTSTLPEVYFAKVPPPVPAPAPSTPQVDALTSEAAASWAAIKDTGKIPVLEYFGERYKGTVYAELALARAKDLARQQAAAAAEAKAVSVPDQSVAIARPPQDHGELVRQLQQQLRRVGCLNAEADGTWGEKSRAALREFARYAKLSIEDDEPNISYFDAATAAKSRVCPLQCGDDEVMRDGRCVAKERPSQRREAEHTRHGVRQSTERTRRATTERPRSSGSGICFGAGRTELVACK